VAGQALRDEDLYLAVPLQKGQLSCREIMRGQVLLAGVKKDQPLTVEQVDSPYAYDE
jgi:N-acetylneuraminate synthase